MVVIEGLNFFLFYFFFHFFYSAFLTFHILLSLFYYSHMCAIDQRTFEFDHMGHSACMTFLQVSNFFYF